MQAWGKFLGVVLLTALVGISAGCSLDSRIDLHFAGNGPIVVDEISQPAELDSHRSSGVTERRRVVGINCSVTIAYEANDIGGPGVIVQTRVVRLHTRRRAPGTAYDLDCSGPLILQLPAAASDVRSAAGTVSLPVREQVTSVPLAFGKRLHAQRGTRFALVTRPDTLPDGDYSIDISFGLRSSRPFREKVVYAASVSCGGSKYVEPIVPAVSRMKRVPALKITPSAGSYRLSLPRIAGTRENGVPVHTQRRLSCSR